MVYAIINYGIIVQTGQGLGEMPQLQILTIISESVSCRLE